MKLLDRLRRPAWQHADPARRAEAVRSGADPELKTRLRSIAADDADPAVRMAALRRIDDAPWLLARLGPERDAGCQDLIRARLERLLTDPAVPLAERTALLQREDLPPELLEHLAEHAPEAVLRGAALLRVHRGGLLQRRCVEDPSAEIRLALLLRIDDEPGLQRIAERSRRTDKRLSQAARERIDQLRIERGDPEALRQRAMALCDQLERDARTLPPDLAARVESLRAEWGELGERVGEDLQRRVSGYLQRAEDAIASIQRARDPAVTTAPAETEPVARESIGDLPAAHDTVAGAAAETAPPAGLQADAEAVDIGSGDHISLRDSDAPGETQQPSAADTRHATTAAPARDDAAVRAELRSALHDGREAVENQRLGAATNALRQIRALLADGLRPGAAETAALREIEAGVDELAQWQRWAGNRVRARLCDEVEALLGSGLHPDAVANRVRELQDEWKRVEASEAAAPDSANQPSGQHGGGIGRRFHALCQRALAPARPYFEQRRALRNQRRVEINALIGRAQANLGDEATAVDGELRRELAEALRRLDEVDPAARGELGRKLREQLGRIDAIREAERERHAEAKQKLIARLKRELVHADPQQAVDAAKRMQAEWKALPRAGREQEDALWSALRELTAPLFDRERESQAQELHQRAAASDEQAGILREIEALANDTSALLHADTRLVELESRYLALTAPPPAVDPARAPARRDADPRRAERPRPPRTPRPDARLTTAIESVRKAREKLLAERREQEFDALCNAVDLLGRRVDAVSGDDTEVATSLGAEWQQLALAEADRRTLEPMWNGIGEHGLPATDPAHARAVVIEAELAAGIESPADEQAMRRELQMQRLARRLQGDADLEPVDGRGWLLRWAACCSLPKLRREPLQQRLFSALRALDRR